MCKNVSHLSSNSPRKEPLEQAKHVGASGSFLEQAKKEILW